MATRSTEIPDYIASCWQRFVDTLSEFIPVPSVMINRVEPQELVVFLSNIDDNNPFPRGTRFQLQGLYCETTARRRQMLKVVDARKDPVWADSPTAKVGIYAYLGYPLLWPDGDVFGTLCVIDTKANEWGERYEHLIFNFKEAVETHLALLHAFEKLRQTTREVKTLQGLLPICSHCKKVRDDEGYWNQIESYVSDHSEAEFSHSICPDCVREHYPDLDITAVTE